MVFVSLFFWKRKKSVSFTVSLPPLPFLYLHFSCPFLVVYFSLRKLWIPSFHLFRLEKFIWTSTCRFTHTHIPWRNRFLNLGCYKTQKHFNRNLSTHCCVVSSADFQLYLVFNKSLKVLVLDSLLSRNNFQSKHCWKMFLDNLCLASLLHPYGPWKTLLHGLPATLVGFFRTGERLNHFGGMTSLFNQLFYFSVPSLSLLYNCDQCSWSPFGSLLDGSELTRTGLESVGQSLHIGTIPS